MNGNRVLWILLCFIMIIPVMDSCKKGADDPFFSIRSRKSRVVGDWDINTYNQLVTVTLDDGAKAIVDFQISGNSVTYVVDSTEVPGVSDTTRTQNGEVINGYYNFDKNGNMEHFLHYTLVNDCTVVDPNTEWTYTMITTTTTKVLGKGTWNFLGNIDDYKNKERLALVYETKNEDVTVNNNLKVYDDAGEAVQALFSNSTSRSNTEYKYANGEYAEVWAIQMLKSKEMILFRDIDDLINYNDTDTNSTDLKKTISGYETMNLKQE